VLQLAINYGGRAELLHAVRVLARQVKQGHLDPEAIDEPHIEAALQHVPDLPAPDLLIRTSGEQRLSNFLLWQAAYSELYFTPAPWPAFDVGAFHAALHCFEQRKRRYGG
jgi:undecaprenyl diphosphate synthase